MGYWNYCYKEWMGCGLQWTASKWRHCGGLCCLYETMIFANPVFGKGTRSRAWVWVGRPGITWSVLVHFGRHTQTPTLIQSWSWHQMVLITAQHIHTFTWMVYSYRANLMMQMEHMAWVPRNLLCRLDQPMLSVDRVASCFGQSYIKTYTSIVNNVQCCY